MGSGHRQRLHHPCGPGPNHGAGQQGLHRQGRCHRAESCHRLPLPLPRLRSHVPHGPHPHLAHGQRRAGQAGGVLVRQLPRRLLQRVRPCRQARRPGRHRAPGRLHLRIRPGRLRIGQRRGTGPPVHARQGDPQPGRLPPAPRTVQERRRPAGPARRRPHDRRVGRPRNRQRHLARRCRQPPSRHRRQLQHPQGSGPAGVPRVDAHPQRAA